MSGADAKGVKAGDVRVQLMASGEQVKRVEGEDEDEAFVALSEVSWKGEGPDLRGPGGVPRPKRRLSNTMALEDLKNLSGRARTRDNTASPHTRRILLPGPGLAIATRALT